MIELMARYWKCNLGEAIHRLRQCGVKFPPDAVNASDIEYYEKCYIDEQRRLRQLLEDARVQVHAGEVGVSGLMHQTGIRDDLLQEYWPRRMGRFFGGVPVLRAVQAFHPHIQKMRDHKGDSRIFDRGWKNTLVIPFHDLPGRVGGVLFIGRHGKQDEDYRFKIIDKEVEGGAIPTAQVGACMADVLYSPTAYSDLLGNDVFVLNDPVTALKLQSRHMRDSNLPLPVVGTYSALIKRHKGTQRTRRDWQLAAYDIWKTQPNRRYIFWDSTLTASVFNMAARCGGFICIHKHLLFGRRNTPLGWLQILRREAKHWTVLLDETLGVLPDDAADVLLRSLDIPGNTMQEFKNNCSNSTRAKLDRYKSENTALCDVTINGKSILEIDGGWCLAKKSEQITDCILRVEKIICQEDDDEADPYYVGRIIHGEDQIQFAEPLSKMENTGPWLRKKVLAKLGHSPIVRRAWWPHLLDIARAFHKPEVVLEDGRFGWKPRESCFALPNFNVPIGGGVQEDRAHVVDDYAPGLELEPPAVPPPDIALLMKDTPPNRMFWATTACVAANVLAPAISQPIAGVGVLGHGALLNVKPAAQVLGCRRFEVSANYGKQNHYFADRINAIIDRHKWPVICDSTKILKRVLDEWLGGNYIHNAFLHMTEEQANIWSVIDDWRFIREDTPIEGSPAVQLYGKYVLPLWLERICSHRLELNSDDDIYVYRVLDDLADMMESYGNGDFIRDCRSHLDDVTTIDESAFRFALYIYKLIEEGYLTFAHEGHEGNENTKFANIIRIDNDELPPGIFVPRDAITRSLIRHGVSVPDPGRITQALQAAGALDREIVYDGLIGWFIVESWWSRQINQCRVRHQHRLKVIGGDQ